MCSISQLCHTARRNDRIHMNPHSILNPPRIPTGQRSHDSNTAPARFLKHPPIPLEQSFFVSINPPSWSSQ